MEPISNPQSEYANRLQARQRDALRHFRRYRFFKRIRGMILGVVVLLALLGEKERLAKLHTTKRLHAAVGAYRFFELLLLAGFCASGYVAAWIVGTVAIGDLLVNGAIFGLYRSKWLSLIADPRIFLAQKLYAFGSALFIALAAPQTVVAQFGQQIRTGFSVSQRLQNPPPDPSFSMGQSMPANLEAGISNRNDRPISSASISNSSPVSTPSSRKMFVPTDAL